MTNSVVSGPLYNQVNEKKREREKQKYALVTITVKFNWSPKLKVKIKDTVLAANKEVTISPQ